MDITKTLAEKAYQKVIIYYFSGTGNSGNVALWLSQVAEEKGIESRIINIAQTDRRSIAPPETDSLVVFISPIHGFNYPPVMLNFLFRFPKGKNKVVLMNTRAGMLIGKFITPGLTGFAFYLSALILLFKGFSIKAILPVDMPSNWISLHPGLNDTTVRYLHSKNKERVVNFAQKIFQGKSHFKALSEIYDILFAPIALGYFLVGRFFFAKTFYASRDCNNCDICIKSCPVKAIIKVDNRPFWTFNCESCMKCMSNCPKKAIETGHGYIAAFVHVFLSVILVLFYKYFEVLYFPIENPVLKIVVESVLFIAFIGFWYRLVHWLLRFKIFERLTVYTSLTKYKWWGRRYKALKADAHRNGF
jgi:Pyruvate/2-oxoacid:ferredoxin oxidoreductase delta subunit/flavodoxin